MEKIVIRHAKIAKGVDENHYGRWLTALTADGTAESTTTDDTAAPTQLSPQTSHTCKTIKPLNPHGKHFVGMSGSVNTSSGDFRRIQTRGTTDATQLQASHLNAV